MHYCTASRFLSQIEIVAKLNSNPMSTPSSLEVQKAISKTMQTLGMLKWSFNFMSKDSFLFLYRTYNRSHHGILILYTILVTTFDKRHHCLRVGTKLCYEVSKESVYDFAGPMKTHWFLFNYCTVTLLLETLCNWNFLKSSMTANSFKSKLDNYWNLIT